MTGAGHCGACNLIFDKLGGGNYSPSPPKRGKDGIFRGHN